MSEMEQTASILRLVGVRGPAIAPVEITRAGGVIGRSSGCEVRLADATISRRHAEISWIAGRWMLIDLGGANGTWLNDVRIEGGGPVPLAPGDRIVVGPWVLQVGTWTPTTVAMTMESDAAEAMAQVQSVDPIATGRIAHHRFQLLIDSAGRINEASSERALAMSLLESVIDGTGYGRAALVRLAGNDEGVEILGSCARDGGEPDQFSRTLVVRASGGEMVTLASQESPANWGQSIAELNIHSAMCCPILVDEQVAACLYLDARGSEQEVQPDAAGFCQALSQLAGLAMANLRRQDMRLRQREMDEEMNAAREAQQLMVPMQRAELSTVEYEVEFLPGRIASGDLFDVVLLSDERVAVILGDVSGKGVGAAILMAASQSYLHASLLRHESPAAAVLDLNEFVLARSAANRFLTLWVGVFSSDGSVTYVDAGHGHWAQVNGDEVTVHHAASSPLVGAFDDITFEDVEIQLCPGERIVLMTDGIPEQPGTDGEQYGSDRVQSVLASTRTCKEDVTELLAAVRSWSVVAELADDTTVASVKVIEPS
ncbi:MAG: SpoIIE family protein phosphatase [Phycisphaerales bacterium]|nr:SpoIIE family protein phosphatase [Phycisphaerales bacterium]